MDKIKALTNFIKEQKLIYIDTINTSRLIIDDKVRNYCIENKCGQYGNNFMCPPYIGEVTDFRNKLKEYKASIIVLEKERILNPINREEVYRAADRLNNKLLEIETKAKELGYKNCKVLFAGNCRFCLPCKIQLGYTKCPYPNKGRPSSEGLGIDVIKTLDKIGINLEFKEHEVTWVGMILL